MTARGVPPTGWHVEVLHPDTGRKRVPDVIDLQNAPVFNPGPNALPRVRIPVRKDDVWLSDAYNDDPEMRVWRDGRRLPIEVLRDVEQREDATVLVGVGGVELETRVRAEFNDDRRHVAAGDLVESETGYAAEFPEPDTATLQDVIQQEADTQAEFESVSSFPTDSPIHVDNGAVKTHPVTVVQEGLSRTDSSGIGFFTDEPEFSDGQGVFINQDAGNFIEWEFEVPYDHTEHLAFSVRDRMEVGAEMDGRWVLNGEEITEVKLAGSDLNWFDWSDEGDWSGSLNVGGTNTLRIEILGTTDANDYEIDVWSVYDERAKDDLFFDNEVHEPSGYLDGPGTHARADAAFDNAPIAFNVVAGSADITMNDTSGAQRLQISNDNGATWLPDDGTENNTTSISVDYPTAGSGSRLRVTLDAWEPDGPRDETPRLNYASQELDAYELRADTTQELLLIAETFDNSLASVLSDIGEPAERSWGLRTDANGDIVVRFVQNGQFTADFTPEFSDRTREKLGKTYDSVTVKGSNEPESNVPYTASTSFTALPRENILTGSETVYDDTRNYERGDDYEMRYREGEIRATDGSDLDPGTDYRIDFRYQAEGTFEAQDAPADPEELVETVPGVTSARLAEQVAFVIQTEADTPRYAAEVTIPDPDPRFDPTEALPPAALGLPDVGDDLEVRGEPQLTEEGLRVRFGTRPSVEQTQQRLSRQLSRVSDRS